MGMEDESAPKSESFSLEDGLAPATDQNPTSGIFYFLILLVVFIQDLFELNILSKKKIQDYACTCNKIVI